MQSADTEIVNSQFDIHSPATTVREALMFSAQLRLVGTNKKQLISFVDEVTCPCLQLYFFKSLCLELSYHNEIPSSLLGSSGPRHQMTSR
jgi:hypothetical protein